MELRQRKRIVNSLPRFNEGVSNGVTFDSQQAFSSIGSTPTSYLQTNATSLPSQQQISSMKTPSAMGSSVGSINDMVYQNVYNTGEIFSQNSKFTNGTARDIKNYGGAIAKMIPGKYGKLAQGVVDLASDTIGMYNYKHDGTEMMNESGTSGSTINGVNYNVQNALDTRKAYSDVKSTGIKNAVSGGFKGSAAGFVVGGPLGAVLGGVLGNTLGIFAGRKAMIRQKRINRNNAMQTEMLNQDQMAQADTEGLQTKYYQKNYDTTGTVLFANKGKDLRSRKRLINITKV